MAAFAAAFVFAGCNKTEEEAPKPELKLAEATAEVAADATTYELTVEANCDWTATATEGVALDPSAGKGNAEVTLTFAANEAYEPVTLHSRLKVLRIRLSLLLRPLLRSQLQFLHLLRQRIV